MGDTIREVLQECGEYFVTKGVQAGIADEIMKLKAVRSHKTHMPERQAELFEMLRAANRGEDVAWPQTSVNMARVGIIS
jgi:hypothetical protein